MKHYDAGTIVLVTDVPDVDKPGLSPIIGCRAEVIEVNSDGYVKVLDDVPLTHNFSTNYSMQGWYVTEVCEAKPVPTFVSVEEATRWLEANA